MGDPEERMNSIDTNNEVQGANWNNTFNRKMGTSANNKPKYFFEIRTTRRHENKHYHKKQR